MAEHKCKNCGNCTCGKSEQESTDDTNITTIETLYNAADPGKRNDVMMLTPGLAVVLTESGKSAIAELFAALDIRLDGPVNINGLFFVVEPPKAEMWGASSQFCIGQVKVMELSHPKVHFVMNLCDVIPAVSVSRSDHSYLIGYVEDETGYFKYLTVSAFGGEETAVNSAYTIPLDNIHRFGTQRAAEVYLENYGEGLKAKFGCKKLILIKHQEHFTPVLDVLRKKD